MVLTLPVEDALFMKSQRRMTAAEHEEFNATYGVDAHHDAPTPPDERFQDQAGHNGH